MVVMDYIYMYQTPLSNLYINRNWQNKNCIQVGSALFEYAESQSEFLPLSCPPNANLPALSEIG